MRLCKLLIAFFISCATWCQSAIEKKEILVQNDSIQLPGTLTHVHNATQLIIWIHGSGNVDRNGNQAGVNINANYIQQFREEINLKNISFFSYDKRTANPNNLKYLKGIIFEDLVKDAKVVIDYFQKNHNYEEIVLIGHSQGSLVGMMAATKVQKFISLAGPGESIDKTILKQVATNSPFLAESTKAHIKELKATGTIKEINPMLMTLFAKPNHAFLSNWFQFDPVKEISQVSIPTLIINGDADLQIKIKDAQQLKEANPNAEFKIIKNMNHVLKTVSNRGDNQASYFSSKFPISKELISVITEFVKK